MTAETVILAWTGEYEDRTCVGVFLSRERAIQAIKDSRPEPYKVRWMEDSCGELVGDFFEDVPGVQSKHTSHFDFEEGQ